MSKDNPEIIEHYGSMYTKLFRYWPILASLIIASIVSFFLLSWNSAQSGEPLPAQVWVSTNTDTPTPTVWDNTWTRDQDDPLLNIKTLQEDDNTDERENSVWFKNANYNLDKLLDTVDFVTEDNRLHTDSNTIISNASIALEDNKKTDVSITFDHTSWSKLSIIQLNTPQDSINEKIDATIANENISSIELFSDVRKLLQEYTDREITCNNLIDTLSWFWEIECNDSFVHVSIVNELYTRSYHFYHDNFALLRIETSDEDETQSLSSIKNVNTNKTTFGAAIDRILKKRLEEASSPLVDNPSLAVAAIIKDTLGTSPDSISEKNWSFGITYTLKNTSFLSIYSQENNTLNWLLFSDIIINNKPLSVPQFSLKLDDTRSVNSFITDPISYLETLRPGLKDVLSSQN